MDLADLRRRVSGRTMAMLGCGLIVFGLLFLLWLRQRHTAAQLRQHIAAVQADIDLQRRLQPLRRQLAMAEAALPPADCRVTDRPLPLGQVGALVTIVEAMAKPLGLRVQAVTPEASLAGKNGLLAVQLRLDGSMAAVRAFLLALCRYAPLAKIESASTEIGEQGGRELAVRCWLRVQAPGTARSAAR